MHDSDTIDVFLLVEQPRQRLGHWSQALAILDSPSAPSLAGIHAHYDPSCDQAMLELRYDPGALGGAGLKFVIDAAVLAEVGMVQPDELSEGERTRFLGERLSRCKLSVLYQRSVVSALVELVKRIKDSRRPAAQPPPIPDVPPRVTSPSGPRPDAAPKVNLASGTRDDLQTEAAAAAVMAGTSSRHVVSRDQRKATQELQPVQTAALVTKMRAPTHVGRDQVTRPHQAIVPEGVGSMPYLPAQLTPDGGTIHARYLRSGRWVPLRVGALSLKGASMLTGALPRLDDRVDIALAYGPHRALVRGLVAKVSTVREAAHTGAATFTVAFELDPPARRQLTGLLTAAREAKVTIKPPPPRATRRFPVEWPVTLGTAKGPVQAQALDISTAGLFVTSPVPLQVTTNVNVAVVLDDGAPPVAGATRVVRHIGEGLAKQCGIAAGYGLEMLDMAESDRLRWLGFLARVERRAEKRVLVGASPERLAELQSGLAACGYAVVGGTDPGALVQLARAEDRPADAALIDSGWLNSGGSASWVENLFSARNVPFVTLQGDARRARQALDKLLEVVV